MRRAAAAKQRAADAEQARKDELKAAGEAALTASKFGTALEKFNQALSVDPADNQLVFRIKRAEEMQQKFEAKRAKQAAWRDAAARACGTCCRRST